MIGIGHQRLGLGVGLDLPWRGPYGIVGDRVADRTVRFLKRYADRFAYLFVSWQPKDHRVPCIEDVTDVFDALFAEVPIAVRALHQTAFNLAGGDYDREKIIAFTNALIARYGFRWVNEDLGLWSVRGWPLPYPQPPPLTEEGIAYCARVCAEVDRDLHAPLVVEFPGFEVPAPWLHGELDAYDVFRRIVEGAEVQCNLDTGHLLTWRWLQGHRGDALLDGLERLPLDRCVEIHCAGTSVVGDALIDAHHGVLLEAQLALAERLMALCDNLVVVTFEDPRFDDAGELPPAIDASLRALETRTQAWMARPSRSSPPPLPVHVAPTTPTASWEASLVDAFQAPTAFGRRCRAQVLTRRTRGLGRLDDRYPQSIAAWHAVHPHPTPADADDALVRAFLASEHGQGWSAYAWAHPGTCIEDAFGRFVAPGSDEHLQACARVLALHPDPPFDVPTGFQRAPRGWFLVTAAPVLYAAVDGKVVSGPVTPLIAAILAGDRPVGAAAAVAELAAMGLVVG